MKEKLKKNGEPRKIQAKRIIDNELPRKVSKEKLSQFWNWHLNPITGYSVPVAIRKESTFVSPYYLDKTKL